jgi:ribosomal protein S18 acetylase RimI-like enzyme
MAHSKTTQRRSNGFSVPFKNVECRDVVELEDVTHPLFAETLQLYKENFPDSYEMDSDTLISLLKQRILRVFVSISSYKVSACAMLTSRTTPGLCHLDYLFVNKKLQGKGIGSTFMKNLLEFLSKERYFAAMTLECVDGLVGWYQKLGGIKSKLKPSKFGEENPKVFNFMYIPIGDMKQPTDKEIADVFFGIRNIEGFILEESDEYMTWKSTTSFVPCK